MESIYEQYATIDAQIRTLTDQKDAIKEQILTDMAERGVEKDATSVGSFTISKLKKWTYTDKVTAAKEEYEAIKAHEESAGIATFVENPSLRFTSIKL